MGEILEQNTVMVKTKHYQNLTNNKSDVKFIERLVGKKADTFKKLLEQEEDLDLLINYNARLKIVKSPKGVSRKLLSKYLIMHHFNQDYLTVSDKSYLAKIIGFYWNKDKIAELEKKVFHTMTPSDEQSARIHLSLFCLNFQSYQDITGFSKPEAIKKIKSAFEKNTKTKNIGTNLIHIIQSLRILKRSELFEKFFVMR